MLVMITDSVKVVYDAMNLQFCSFRRFRFEGTRARPGFPGKGCPVLAAIHDGQLPGPSHQVRGASTQNAGVTKSLSGEWEREWLKTPWQNNFIPFLVVNSHRLEKKCFVLVSLPKVRPRDSTCSWSCSGVITDSKLAEKRCEMCQEIIIAPVLSKVRIYTTWITKLFPLVDSRYI